MLHTRSGEHESSRIIKQMDAQIPGGAMRARINILLSIISQLVYCSQYGVNTLIEFWALSQSFHGMLTTEFCVVSKRNRL